jgi:hypothetical protein
MDCQNYMVNMNSLRLIGTQKNMKHFILCPKVAYSLHVHIDTIVGVTICLLNSR